MNAKVLRTKLKLRAQRKSRIRGKISGTAQKPRVSIYKSNKHLSAQAIDDVAGVTLAAIHTKKLGMKANIEDAKKLAAEFAQSLKQNGIEAVVFDRNGYLYHGVVAAFAESLRENQISL